MGKRAFNRKGVFKIYVCGVIPIIKIILVIAFLVFAAFAGQIQISGAANMNVSRHELRVAEINTRAFVCDGTPQELDSELHDARIRKIYVWFGAYTGTTADITATLHKYPEWGDGVSIVKTGWDHYAEPVGVAGQSLWFDFAPDYIELRGKDTLKLYAACNPLDEASETKKAHVIVLLYYY